jgi:hypothetical protein
VKVISKGLVVTAARVSIDYARFLLSGVKA